MRLLSKKEASHFLRCFFSLFQCKALGVQQMVSITGRQLKCAGLGHEFVFVVPETEHFFCDGERDDFALVGGKFYLLEVNELLDRSGVGTHQIPHIEHDGLLAGKIAVVMYSNVHPDAAIGGHFIGRQRKAFVNKVGVAQTVTKEYRGRLPQPM